MRYFAAVDSGLYDAILNMCADPSKMCMSEMMHIDMMGGGGKESQENREASESMTIAAAMQAMSRR